MSVKTLIIGGTGTVGSRLVSELDRDCGSLDIRLATRSSETAEKWRAGGRDAVVLDLDNPANYPAAFRDIDRVFLLTTYSADMLFWSKYAIDAAKDAGVRFLVHLGVYSTGRDVVPHFVWHQMIDTYLMASGLSWTILHPNNIIDTSLVPSNIKETNTYMVGFGHEAQGIVFSSDIGAVAAQVLRDGPEKHHGKEYWLSTEVLTGQQICDEINRATGRNVKPCYTPIEAQRANIRNMPTNGGRLYMESAAIYMETAANGKMPEKLEVRDDVLTVLGRPGKTVAEWAKEYFSE